MYRSESAGLALCGLGPIVKGYSVLGTRKHIPSAADAVAGECADFVAFVLDTREMLEKLYGRCLLTEHGRLPACIDISGTADPHCYHAHFLVFPGVPPIEATARSYFARMEHSSSLQDALEMATAHDEYFLLSQEPDRFLVLTRPGMMIRQFARFLVAESLGHRERANWRRFPLLEESMATATELRALIAEKGQPWLKHPA